ncbi:MAG: DEAD/DEAH box helicase [Verrucomicrobia bacterium]|nr:DEAD/DEAH box helicase [Verrucomicrobiota bacterium]
MPSPPSSIIHPPSPIRRDDRVRVSGRYELGVGEVLRVCETGDVFLADVVFESRGSRRLETLPLQRLEKAISPWQKLKEGRFDPPNDFLLRQLAWQFALGNTGGELTNSRTQLLPHQILLTHDVVKMNRRRLLVADEVGLGKTIETGMIIRELIARGQANRVLILTPAGLVKNWQDELRGCFRLEFEILGIDFQDYAPASWENHSRVIASIDTVKRPVRLDRLMNAPRFDLIIVDEAHHISRIRYGKKLQVTMNYRALEALRGHTRDLLFLSATPHQGNNFQFWSLVNLLDDHLFDSPEAMLAHSSLLNRAMIRRTKREVVDAQGRPLFVRRQVHTESFEPALREQRFYEQLTEYLKTGYEAAGLFRSGRTTSAQRAIGFVMTAFQKMMSSSPRAIKQALRRRLLVLLVREQIELEKKRRKNFAPELPAHIVRLQDEMRILAREILSTSSPIPHPPSIIHHPSSNHPTIHPPSTPHPPSSNHPTIHPSSTLHHPSSPLGDADADAYIAQVRQRIARKMADAEEETDWSLDADEEGDEGVYADAEIPDESARVRELVGLVPEGTDRKFDRLLSVISHLRSMNENERFVIFTQYRETLEFLRIELARIFGDSKIATIKGGPLEDKIEAAEQFWDENGAKFLISTSAGGEGINLQCARVLVNYDLPWNPMAVEQRIGRIHRFGQKDVAQVYSLIAKDTVEERIYGLLNEKLQSVAQAIGKTDPETGEPLEDFRLEILGFLGSNPNYQQLFKQALVDRDYHRTERQIEEMMEQAQMARTVLTELSQDLTHFNLEHYRRIAGRFSLQQLGAWCREAIVRLGGSVLTEGEFWQILTPECLKGCSQVAPKYAHVTFNRDLATRKRNCELFGIGHPLVDALLAYLQNAPFNGDTACFAVRAGEQSRIEVRYRVTWDRADQGASATVVQVILNGDARVDEIPSDILRLGQQHPQHSSVSIPEDAEARVEEALRLWISSRKTEFPAGTISRCELLGVSV